MSYYPHNQPIVTSINSDEGEPGTVLQSATNTLLPTGTLVDRTSAGSPSPDMERSGTQPMALPRTSESVDQRSRPSDSSRRTTASRRSEAADRQQSRPPAS